MPRALDSSTFWEQLGVVSALQDGRDRRLELMRDVARSLADSLVERFGDSIEGIIVEGSVARGNIHESSDIDLVVFLTPRSLRKLAGHPLYESLKAGGFSVDVDYVSLEDTTKEVSSLRGSDWEMASSALGDALVLYDRNGRIREAKRRHRGYSKEMRIRNTAYLYNKALDLGEAIYYFWLREDYETTLIYSRMYAEGVLRVVFPIFGVKCPAEKQLLAGGFSLVKDKAMAANIRGLLLCTREESPTRQDIDQRLSTIVRIGDWVREKATEEALEQALPPRHVKVEKVGDALRS